MWQMRSRLLACTLLVYIALDFGNPLMPGAVRFVSGELDTVEGAENRAPDTPAPIIAATPRADIDLGLERRERASAEVPDAAPPQPRFAARSSPPAASGDSTSSPDDD
jgi:hypothetical protein